MYTGVPEILVSIVSRQLVQAGKLSANGGCAYASVFTTTPEIVCPDDCDFSTFEKSHTTTLLSVIPSLNELIRISPAGPPAMPYDTTGWTVSSRRVAVPSLAV